MFVSRRLESSSEAKSGPDFASFRKYSGWKNNLVVNSPLLTRLDYLNSSKLSESFLSIFALETAPKKNAFFICAFGDDAVISGWIL